MIRGLDVRTGVLPRTHGSALFTRGETQALVTATLGTARDAQVLDELMGERTDTFLFHYNFPPYSVGETGMVGSPKRREIGHGRLAKRGVLAVMPDMDKFPYTVRVVSEITESNGSSSMASVCGASLALMDAGVPIKAAVAGIAMGLVKKATTTLYCLTFWATKITWAIWTSKLRVLVTVSLHCRWISKLKVSPKRSCRLH